MASRPTFGILGALLLTALMLAAGLAAVTLAPAAPALGAAHPAPTAVAPLGSAPASPAPAAAPTHGDLVVTGKYYINATKGVPVYFQAGNITVEAGGQLFINRVNISFVQFIGSTGTPIVRLSHIVHFTVDAGGKVLLHNATVTTDMYEINAYPKLNLTDQGTMVLYNSTLAFPGWINVEGAGAVMTLNGSQITRNPTVVDFKQNPTLSGAENYAPTLRVSDGASVDLFGSNVSHVFADNYSRNDTPREEPLAFGDTRNPNGSVRENVSVTPGIPENLTLTATPNSSAALAQDWLYPTGITGGDLQVLYNDSGTYTTIVNVTVWYDGKGYGFGLVSLESGTVAGRLNLPFPAALTDRINALGLMDYLNFTGDFGVGPAKIAVDLVSVTNTGDVTLTNVGFYLLLDPPVSYDIGATGAGTHFNTVDTSLGLTFRAIASNPLSQGNPNPWLANKLSLTDGANASLANLVVPNPIPAVFETSAVITDATSHAYLYRWAQVNLTGLGGLLPVHGGELSAYYAYNDVQENNKTANAANDLATWSPSIWAYVQYWDKVHARPAYAESGYGGVVSMLLVSNEITKDTLPDGIFMGGYHLIVHIPVPTGNTHAFNGSVSPYPVGVALATPGYDAADFAHPQNFPSYFAGVAVKSLTLTDDGVAITNATVRIGDTLGVDVTLNDTGTASIFQLAPNLLWNASAVAPLNSSAYTVTLDAVGQTFSFKIAWIVNETVTGLHGQDYDHAFDLKVVWNQGELSLGGGNLPVSVPVTIDPSLITVTDLATAGLPVPVPPATTTLSLSSTYVTTGVIQFHGTAEATIDLYLVSLAGVPALVAVGDHVPGHFTLVWLAPLSDHLTPGTTYTERLTVSYNEQVHTYSYTGEYVVPPTPTAKKNLLTEKFLGLELWMWIAIAGAVAAAILAFVWVTRRGAAGKVVECGECGTLVPETAISCPKCGAEFESDLVRCSRCASTIPANSQFCPECAAQLLGKPGEGGRDPERDGFADFTERFRVEAKKELGDNYNEGSFWDWWKRQPTYTSFSQWKLQQQQGAPRPGMMAPPVQTTEAAPPRSPPRAGGGAAAPAPGDRSAGARTPSAAPPPPAATAAAPAPAAGGLKPCPNCHKEIPPEYLVCPFCGSVTQ